MIPETLGKWLIKEGLWKKQRKRSPYPQRREHKAQFGEVMQIDSFIHDWFGEGKHINMVTTTSLNHTCCS